MSLKKLRQNGDTIIEVLMALAVLSIVLTGAYVSSNRSFKNSRQAQERGEALKLIEGQVEQLKAMSEDGNGGIFSNLDYCISSGTIISPSGSANCSFDSGSVSPGRYNVSIKHSSTTDPVFTVQATWENAIGNGNDQLKIVYKHNE